MPDAYPAFTPVNLLTGFLGSGKTTLLRQLLGSPELAGTAVLINEFGEVGLDHHLVERIDETVVLLRSGCLCCTIRGELAHAIRDLHARRDRGTVPAFRRLIIESSGLADPFPVLTTLKADPVLRHHFRAGTVTTTLDAVNGLRQIERHVESIRQLAVADHLVLTKTDLAADPASVTALLTRVRQINPDAPVRRAADFDARTLLSDGAPATRSLQVDNGAARNSHTAHIRSFTVTVSEPLDWTAFGIWLSMLLNRHGDKVLRVKGILSVAGEAAPVAIHGVQQLVHNPVHMAGWPDADHSSRIVFIVDGIDPALIRRSLAAFNELSVGNALSERAACVTNPRHRL
jgi:G3E family GTPase